MSAHKMNQSDHPEQLMRYWEITDSRGKNEILCGKSAGKVQREYEVRTGRKIVMMIEAEAES